jgi:hypothetical protein
MKRDGNRTDNWLSTAQAAEKLGTTALHILMLVRRGVLLGVEDDGAWLVEPASLEEALHRRKEDPLRDLFQCGCSQHAGGCGPCS